MLIAVPEWAALGVENVTHLSTSTPISEGTFVEHVRVALLLANPAYVGQHLTESCPADSTLVTFSHNTLPWSALLFATLDLPESALQGYWLHVAEGDQPSLRMLVDGSATGDGDCGSNDYYKTDAPHKISTAQCVGLGQLCQSAGKLLGATSAGEDDGSGCRRPDRSQPGNCRGSQGMRGLSYPSPVDYGTIRGAKYPLWQTRRARMALRDVGAFAWPRLDNF
eukprot:183213-Amphidinium_carterae.2